MEVVCDCAVEVWDFEFSSDLVNSQRPKVRVSVEMECSTLCRDTGGKGPNNQWAHAEYIENPVNK